MDFHHKVITTIYFPVEVKRRGRIHVNIKRKMISLRDILNSGKNLLEDSIDAFDLGGGEIPDNFSLNYEERHSKGFPLTHRKSCDFELMFLENSPEIKHKVINHDEEIFCQDFTINDANSKKYGKMQANAMMTDTKRKRYKKSEKESFKEELREKVKSKQDFFQINNGFRVDDDVEDAQVDDYIAFDMRKASSILDSLSLQSEDKDAGTDDMNEMDMPNPGSIQHFERLFYPPIPCKNCSSCYDKFSYEIFGE